MVTKTRSSSRVFWLRQGQSQGGPVSWYDYYNSSFTNSRTETVVDSSLTGSPRTEVDAVDRFLADPTNRGDFHAALQESHETAGDAGLSKFRVDRSVRNYTPASVTLTGAVGAPPLVTQLENFMIRPSEMTGTWPALSSFSPLTVEALRARGQSGYLSAMPNRTQVELGTALAEIAVSPAQALRLPGNAIAKRWAERSPTGRLADLRRDGRTRRDRLRGLSREDARAAASDYLAYIFGAAPNIQIMDELADQISRSRKYAEMVSRQGWRRLRRRRELGQVERVISTSTHGSWLHQNVGNTWMLTGPLTKTVTSSQRVWWSGSFRMPTTDTDTWLSQCSALFDRLDILLGMGVDIKMAWDLIPFSFIADWFSNTGDFIENRELVRDYNIVCEYGYVMCHTRTTRHSEAVGFIEKYPSFPGSQQAYGTAPARVAFSELVEVKQRERCGSFGFSTDFSMLNTYQWGALSALLLVNAPGATPRVRT